MPCIQTKANVAIPPEKETAIKTRLGQAIELLPGKSEHWLMLTFEENAHVYFQGDGETPAAFVEVHVFGTLSPGPCGKLAGAVCEILHEELDIDPARIYVKFEATPHWGWNGSTL